MGCWAEGGSGGYQTAVSTSPFAFSFEFVFVFSFSGVFGGDLEAPFLMLFQPMPQLSAKQAQPAPRARYYMYKKSDISANRLETGGEGRRREQNTNKSPRKRPIKRADHALKICAPNHVSQTRCTRACSGDLRCVYGGGEGSEGRAEDGQKGCLGYAKEDRPAQELKEQEQTRPDRIVRWRENSLGREHGHLHQHPSPCAVDDLVAYPLSCGC